MKSLALFTLCSLPSALSLALHARQLNVTATPTSTSLAASPVLPPPSHYTQADVATNCARWDEINSPGPYRCTDFLALYPETTYADLILWNPSVGPLCDNIWGSYWFCSAISGEYIPLPPHPPAGTPIACPGVPQSGSRSAPDCDRWDHIALGASCQTFMSRYPGMVRDDLVRWNPTIDDFQTPCFLNMSFELCTSVVGHVFPPPPPPPPPPTTPTPPTGPPPPAPTQPGVTPDCKLWDTAVDGKGCAAFMELWGVTLENLVLWNPAIGSGCEGLWAGYAVCVGV